MEKITSLEQFSIRQLKMMRKKLKKKKRDPLVIAQMDSEIKCKQLVHRMGANQLALKRMPVMKRVGIHRTSP